MCAVGGVGWVGPGLGDGWSCGWSRGEGILPLVPCSSSWNGYLRWDCLDDTWVHVCWCADGKLRPARLVFQGIGPVFVCMCVSRCVAVCCGVLRFVCVWGGGVAASYVAFRFSKPKES